MMIVARHAGVCVPRSPSRWYSTVHTRPKQDQKLSANFNPGHKGNARISDGGSRQRDALIGERYIDPQTQTSPLLGQFAAAPLHVRA